MPDWIRPGRGPALGAIETARGVGEQDNSVLGNVGRFLSRPGFIVRSLLRGEVVDAGENWLQMGADLFTGGWLNRNFSLANLFTETGDITTAEERPEFSDVLESWGAGAPDHGSIARLGLDLVGGILTDPLTYLGGLPALGKSAAMTGVKAGVAGARVGTAAARTTVGAERLAVAEAGALRGLAGNTLRPGPAVGPARAPLLQTGLRNRLAALPPGQLTPEFLKSDAAVAALGQGRAPTAFGGRLRSVPAGTRSARRARRIVQNEAGNELMRGVLAGDQGARALATQLVDDASGEYFSIAARALATDTNALPARVRQLLEARGLRDPASYTRQAVELAFQDSIQTATAAGNAAEVASLTSAGARWAHAGGMALEEARVAVGVGEAGDFVRMTGHAFQGKLVGLGQEFLEANATLPRRGAAYFGIPFTRRQVAVADLPRPAQALAVGLAGPMGVSTFGRAAGALPRLLHEWAPPNVQRWIDDASSKVSESLMSLYDRTQVGKVSEGLTELRREKVGERLMRSWRYAALTAKTFDGWEGVAAETMGRAMLEEESALWQLQNQVARAPALGHTPQGRPVFMTLRQELESRVTARGGNATEIADDVPSATGAVESWAPWLDPESRLATWLQREAVVGAVLREYPAMAVDQVRATFDGFAKSMAQVQDELVQMGVWRSREALPAGAPGGGGMARRRLGYVPHQASWELQGFMAQAPANEDYRRALLSVFERQRDYPTIAELREALEGVAARYEVPLPDEPMAIALGAGPGRPATVETNMAALMARRLMAHTRTVERWTLVKEGEKRLKIKANANNFDRYISAQLEPLGPRESLIGKILGGGKFYMPVKPKPGESQLDANRRFADAGFKLELRDGETQRVALDWPGINMFYKSSLTLPWPAFHLRNVMSNAVLGALNPEIGLAGVSVMLRTLYDSRWLQALPKMVPSDAGLVMRALRDPATIAASPGLQARLKAIKIGSHSAEEVMRYAREGVLGSSSTERDVFDGIGKFQELGLSMGEQGLKGLEKILTGRDLLSRQAPWTSPNGMVQSATSRWRALMHWPSRVGSYLEDGQRLGTFMHLVGKGLDPQRALVEVNKTFVDYKLQSVTERAIRDLIPFARFTIASAPATAAAVAMRPGNPLGFGLARAPLAAMANDEGIKPETLDGRPAIPMGFDRDGNPVYATSLGLPFDVAGDVGSILSHPLEGTRRVLGGGLTPPLRAIGEAVTGRNFYYGDDAQSFRQAPRFPFPGKTDVTLPSGRVIQEIPGWVNHWLLGALPWARARSELDNALDERKPLFQRVLRGLSGVRYQTADQEREARKALEGWLKGAVDRGEVGVVENFFRRGEVSPEVAQALKALQDLRTAARAPRRE